MTRIFDSFTGSSLDVIGRVEYGLPRFPSEPDDEYRNRIENIYEALKRAYLGAAHNYVEVEDRIAHGAEWINRRIEDDVYQRLTKRGKLDSVVELDDVSIDVFEDAVTGACAQIPRWDTPSAPLDAETLQRGFDSLRRGPQRISDVVSVSVELTNVPAPSGLDVAIVSGTWTPDERACVDCHHFTYFGFDPWCKKHERCTKNGDCCSEWSAEPPKIAESNDVTN